MQRIVINNCFGGFGLSVASYEKLIEWGVPVRAYIDPERDSETGLYKKQPANDGEVVFDRDLDEQNGERRLSGRYWDTWTRDNRTHPLVVRVVEELGEEASGEHAKLKIIEVPDGIEWTIEEYDGNEHVAEVHETWA
jgi:hypothetical protein